MTYILTALIFLVCVNNNLPVNSDVVDLLLETCAVESDFGASNKQIGGGPARGLFQMEPATGQDIINNYVNYRPSLYKITDTWLDKGLMKDLLLDPKFAIIMVRIHYLRVKEPVPSTRLGRAQYWKQHYNTKLGKGTIAKYMTKSNLYLGEE